MTQALREHILVCVPSLDRTVTASIANFFASCHRLNQVETCPYYFSTGTLEGIPGVSYVRNMIAKKFLALPFSRLWMVDDDMVLGDDIFDLLAVEGDIVSPLMPTIAMFMNCGTKQFNFEMTYCSFILNDPSDPFSLRRVKTSDKPAGIMEVEATGTGCTVFSRRVFEDQRMLLPKAFKDRYGRDFEIEDAAPPPYFRQLVLPNGISESGEDVDFCYRAKELGYSVRVAADIEIGHIKTLDVQSLFMIQRYFEDCSTSVKSVTV